MIRTLYQADSLPADFPEADRAFLSTGAWVIEHGRPDQAWPSGRPLVALFTRPMVVPCCVCEGERHGTHSCSDPGSWALHPWWTLTKALARAGGHLRQYPEEYVQLRNAITGQVVVLHG